MSLKKKQPVMLLTTCKLFHLFHQTTRHIKHIHISSSFSVYKERIDCNMEDSNFQATLLEQSKRLAPSLIPESKYKGQAGKVGIFGGSFEYTGAPYFAAISALRVGADLVHVFCTREAAIPLKCYSPELIVHPLLEPNGFDSIKEWLDRFDVILIGPGLGRKEDTFALIESIINYWKGKKKPMVVDADGLFLITQKPTLLEGFNSDVILTPNRMEISRLLKLDNPSLLSEADITSFINKTNWGNNISILVKGNRDTVVTNTKKLDFNGLGGSGRRCGGQGDVLAGSLAVFLFWGKHFSQDRTFIASFAACSLVRECNKRAFAKKGRSMVATDMIEEIHPVFQDMFEVD